MFDSPILPSREPHRLPPTLAEGRLRFPVAATALAACMLALSLTPAAHCQIIDLSLNVYYDIPSDMDSGGHWEFVAKSTNPGIALLNVQLTGISGPVEIQAPRGVVNGSDPAGFLLDQFANNTYLLRQEPAFPTGAEVESAFYGVGSTPNGAPGAVGPAFPPGSLTNLQDVPWATGDALKNDPTWANAARFLSGFFSDNFQPAFGTSLVGQVFTTVGSTTTYGTTAPATITIEVRNNFDPGLTLPDYNGNGIVDAADYVVWRKGLNPEADGNNDGQITDADYDEWHEHFGEGDALGSSPSSGAVPEPASALLLFLALICVRLTRRRSA